MKESQFQRCRKVGDTFIQEIQLRSRCRLEERHTRRYPVMHEDMEEFRIRNTDQEERQISRRHRQISRRHRLAEETD